MASDTATPPAKHGDQIPVHRVYNHSERELIIATDDAFQEQYRLLPRCTSPLYAAPRFLWAASEVPIDGSIVWQLDAGFDVHVSETASAEGEGPTQIQNPLGQTQDLHISGLGITPTDLAAAPAATDRTAWFVGDDDRWVTVLGAGITGLSLAHELVTRGFRVQVIERAHGSPADVVDGEAGNARFQRGMTRPDIGGIARTQWATQPLPRISDIFHELPNGPARPSSLRSVHGDAVWFGAEAGGPQAIGSGASGYHAFGITWTAGVLDDFAEALDTWLHDLGRYHTEQGKGRSVAAVQLVVVVYDGDASGRVRRAYARFREFLDRIEDGRDPDSALEALNTTLARLQVLPTARIDVAEPDPADERDRTAPQVGLLVRAHDDLGLIAGEHGFRFFPGFYRNLRDTMQRTPIFDPVTQSFTPRTAHDNLQQVDWQVIVDPTRSQQTPLSRRPFSTIGGLLAQYRALRRDIGYRPSDLLRFSLRMLRYMTSSTERRAAYYENMSWWTFLSKLHLDSAADEPPFNYGRRFAEALRHSPKALVAMTSEYADARTQGNISVQLLMDQFGLHDQSDSTLNGPTSTSWFTHWRSYLEEQGVRFFLGEVTDITLDTDPTTMVQRADVEIAFAGGVAPAEYLAGESMLRHQAIKAHYIVSALDVASLARVTRELRRQPSAGAFFDLNRLVRDDDNNDRDLGDITTVGVRTSDRFQTLTGIQLYYRRHVSFANGHIYFALSPWGLSAISQIQFWGPFGGHRARLAGNLSIDIGSWRADGDMPDPNTLDRDDIAAGVQEQINRPARKPARTAGGFARPPDPILVRRAMFYHLDDFIGFAPSTTPDGRPILAPRRNHSPFLINVVGDWDSRPRGEPWSPNDVLARDREPGDGTAVGPLWTPTRGGYPVHYHNLVMAGTHLRTFTRMGTMEAANESARHAVNTILDHLTFSWKQIDPDVFTRAQPTPDINVDKNTTPFGDYCDIWNPEELEFQDLEFLRSVDSQLMTAGAKTHDDDTPPGVDPPIAPHLFDILRIDELPDVLDNDRDAINALELIGSVLKAVDDARVDDLPGILAVVDGARQKLAGLFRAR